MMLLFLIWSLFIGVHWVGASGPKKLLTYSLPDNRPLKKALGYDEDIYFNFTELTSKYGYPTEDHIVTTEDGYILNIFRVPPKCDTTKGFPVILMHGLFDSSDAWVVSGPKDGLAYILSDNCYDVWAANGRGNTYSRNHASLNPDKDPEYWNFSFDETGNYDLPAIIDYVIQTTGKPKVYFVGHSQGTTDYFIMASLRPDYNSKIQLSINLAPIAFMKYIKSPIPKFLAQQTGVLKSFLDELGFGEIFAKQQILHHLVEMFCHLNPELVCGTGLALATGYQRNSISPRTMSIAFGHLLVGISSKTISHFGQLIASKKFQRYDEGKQENVQRYGTERPPNYNVSLITSPILLVCGIRDSLSSLEDVNELSSKLPNLVEEYVVPDPTWSHNNHLWGINAPKYVFDKILSYFKVYDLM